MTPNLFRSSLLLLAGCALVFAQPPSGGWRRVNEPPPASAQDQSPQADAFGQPLGQAPAPQPLGQGPAQQFPQDRPPAPIDRPMPASPAELTLPAGTFVTVRVNQMLSSDRN